MRILKLELENLNSLKGKWAVDFTHPDYAKNHDIFVICGSTGSGKTTLLDAITLALYGRTPRLEAINSGEGGNEIMTRGTGFCRASVTYSCKKGIFVSEFQQNRAGMKPNGNLQRASFKITRIDGGDSGLGELFASGSEIVASGTASNLEKETPKIISLDYNQFCRSIMLAQGEFNAFLESDEDSRAKILEKLTGTERYRKIAQNIAEHFKEVKKNFLFVKEQRAEIESQILSDDDENAARKTESELSETLSSLENTLSSLQKELTFFDEFDRLQTELNEAQAQKERIQKEAADFEPNEKRLSRAQNAKKCEADFVSLQNLRSAQQNEKNQIAAFASALVQISQEAETAQKNAETAKQQLSDEETDLLIQQNIWKKVREIDIHLSSASEKVHDVADRKAKSEKSVSESEQKRLILEKDLSALEKMRTDLADYLESHKDDENLPEKIAMAETLAASLFQQQKTASEFERKFQNATQNRQKIESQIETLSHELETIDTEIKHFIASDALFISKLLRLHLEDEKPCPVCGSVYHGKPLSEEHFDGEKAKKIAEQSANLNEWRDSVCDEIQNLKNGLEAAKTDEKNAAENHAASQKNCEELLAKIGEIAPTSENIEAALQELRLRSEQWSQSNSQIKKIESEFSAKSAERRAISENLSSQKENCAELQNAFSLAKESERHLREERSTLFGEKSVDEEESRKNHKILLLKETSERAEMQKNQIKEEKSRLEAQKSQLEKSVGERNEILSTAETEFAQKISANGFENEQVFASSLMSDDEFSALSQKSENLRVLLTQAEASVRNAKKSYESYKSQMKIERSRDEVRAEFQKNSEEKAKRSARLMEIKVSLAQNEQHKAQAQKIRAEYDALSEEFANWQQMKNWIGKDNGDDVSVFVQSLAFNSLLKVTNKNLFGITNRYTVVQKSPLSLEFEIQDIYFDKPRSIANLSGGEKFLVSLSFALGISEFASRNVRVDSLFLDEGFGTLSGELLTEAINALKNLQKDGKMLGIITHVQDVIDEIDQKIEVKPIALGYSELIGSGISS